MDTDTTIAALFHCGQDETVTNLNETIRDLTLVRDIVSLRSASMPRIEMAHKIMMDSIHELFGCLEIDAESLVIT